MPRKYVKKYVPLDATPKILVCKYPGRRITSWGSNCYKADQSAINHRSNILVNKVMLPYSWGVGGSSWFDKNGMVAVHLWGVPVLTTGETVLIKFPAGILCQFIESLLKLVPQYESMNNHTSFGRVAEDHPIYQHLFYTWLTKRRHIYGLHERTPKTKRKTLCDRVYDLKEKADRQRFMEYNVWGNRPYPKSHSHRSFAKLCRIYNKVDFTGRKPKEDNNEPV